MACLLRCVAGLLLLAAATAVPPVAAQSFTVETAGTLEVQRELDVDGAFTYAGTAQLDGTNGVLRVAGDFTKSGGTFTPNGRTVVLDGSSEQSVGGGSIGFAGLELDNTNGAALNSSVNVSSTLRLTSGALTTNGNLTLTSTSETNTAAIAAGGSGSVSGDVTYERFFDKGDDASHFRFLSAPAATLLDDEGSGSNARNLLSNMWTQATGSGADVQVSEDNATVYTYNEGAFLDGDGLSTAWEDVPDLNSGTGNFDPGTGFLAYMIADLDPPAGDGDEGFPQTLTATGSVQAEENDGTPIDLSSQITFTDDGDPDGDNGWNLIANPFMAPIDWESIENNGSDLTNVDNTIYVWDPGAGQYATYTGDGSPGGSGNQDQYIAPFQAFFVKATGSGPDIGGIDSGDKAIGQAPEFKGTDSSAPKLSLQLRPADDSTGETTAFRFAEDASFGKDSYDAYQLAPLATNRRLVASEMAGTDALFDHQNRPVPAEADTIDLSLDITQNGTYTLEASAVENLPSGWNAVLENTDSGTRYDLVAGETATFDYTAPESAPKTASPASPAAAMLKNGGPTVARAKSDGSLPSFRVLVGPSSAIPVELVSFDATTSGTKVDLEWQTASETNNAGFAVERKAEGGVWSQVGFREGAGTTDQAQTYRFADTEVPFEAERVTYRLRQEDLDGTTTLSDQTTVELGPPSETTLHAPFPNPTSRRATLRYETAEATDLEIAVYDVLGRRVRTLADGQVKGGRHEQQVRLSGLAPGTYFVRMRAEGQAQTRTQKLTVVR